LHDAIRVLFTTYTMPSWQSAEEQSSFTGLGIVYNRTKVRSRKVLERLWKAQPTEVLESIVEFWHRDTEPTLVSVPSHCWVYLAEQTDRDDKS
jgi:hypothetical protein